jgi:hypothetical protein
MESDTLSFGVLITVLVKLLPGEVGGEKSNSENDEEGVDDREVIL